MNLEIEAFEGELRDLRKLGGAYHRLLMNAAFPPIQVYNKPETIEELARQLEINSKLTEELDGLGQHCANQQQKIHAMTITCAGQETRLRAINKIASEIFRHKRQ